MAAMQWEKANAYQKVTRWDGEHGRRRVRQRLHVRHDAAVAYAVRNRAAVPFLQKVADHWARNASLSDKQVEAVRRIAQERGTMI